MEAITAQLAVLQKKYEEQRNDLLFTIEMDQVRWAAFFEKKSMALISLRWCLVFSSHNF